MWNDKTFFLQLSLGTKTRQNQIKFTMSLMAGKIVDDVLAVVLQDKSLVK